MIRRREDGFYEILTGTGFGDFRYIEKKEVEMVDYNRKEFNVNIIVSCFDCGLITNSTHVFVVFEPLLSSGSVERLLTPCKRCCGDNISYKVYISQAENKYMERE